MSTISSLPSLPMATLNASLINRTNGPATVRNLAKTAYQDHINGTEQTASKPSQSTGTYKKSAYKDYSALIGANTKASYTPATASEAAAKGTPTHSFFFHDIDSLAAQVGGDEEATLDKSFAKDALDFFTGGNYTDADVDRLNGEMTTALKEMAQQLADTGKIDVGKLESRMTINGAEVSLKDLADFQEMGQKLTPVFDGISAENTRFQDMQATAKMAVARLMGQNFGKTKGDIGAMFSSAVDRLYEKGMDKINELYIDAADAGSYASQDAAQLRDKVNDMFSNLNTTNKSALGSDFSQKLNTMTAMMAQRNNQFGVPSGFTSANAAAKNVNLYFSALYKMLG